MARFAAHALNQVTNPRSTPQIPPQSGGSAARPSGRSAGNALPLPDLSFLFACVAAGPTPPLADDGIQHRQLTAWRALAP